MFTRPGRDWRATMMLVLAVCLAAVLATGLAVAVAANAGGGKGKTHIRRGPVSLVPTTARPVGGPQHVPTNLGKLEKPRPAPSATAPAGGTVGAARTLSSVSAAAAVPPAPSITSKPANPTYDWSATFSFTDSVDGVTFECRLDGAAFAACTSPKIYAGPLKTGSHTFRVRARNASGTSATTLYTWTISALPPPTITAKPANPTLERSATFSFTDGVAGVTFECRLDAAAFAACASGITYAGPLASGNHTFRVRAVLGSDTSATTSFTWTVDPFPALKMKLLVISANGNEAYDFASNPGCFPTACKGAIQTYLDRIGVPYDTMIATQTPDLSAASLAAKLSDGTTGNYQGIILTTGNLTYYNSTNRQYESAFTADEWTALWNYEAQFHVRQVTSYTAPLGPPDDYGLSFVGDNGGQVTQATLTDAGKQVFSYLNPTATVSFKNAWVYFATKRDASVTPLLTTSDGYVIASTNAYADGRENLAVTAANAPWALHTQLLSYGLVNWVTRGVFLGQRHVSLDVQLDDLLIESDMWDVAYHSDTTGLLYRLSGTDFDAAIAWQNATRLKSHLSQFRFEWAFNGEGALGVPARSATPDLLYEPDSLTPAVRAGQGNFSYVNHTYSHEGLDGASYGLSLAAITDDQWAAQQLGLSNYSNESFIQPDISGLGNSAFLQAAFDAGVRYLISDTSQPGWSNPSPNAGLFSTYQPSILIIPRHPSNLFYNLQTKEQWVDEYNWYYGPGGPWASWPTPQTYDQIIGHESDNLLGYLLTWDIDPLMFHQANLGLYDGTHSLLTDLLDATLTKYRALYNLPIVNPTMKQLGEAMKQRMAYNASGADATLRPCQLITVTVATSASVPVTGATAGTSESYGGQRISAVPVTAGTPTTIPVRCP